MAARDCSSNLSADPPGERDYIAPAGAPRWCSTDPSAPGPGRPVTGAHLDPTLDPNAPTQPKELSEDTYRCPRKPL